ncbi:hypothetical protein HDU93_007171 [Gonapodya sp. JEL0774]|nr:hypothetical protein HDU93_007171 [Gonapodya sp. JEL0774]
MFPPGRRGSASSSPRILTTASSGSLSDGSSSLVSQPTRHLPQHTRKPSNSNSGTPSFMKDYSTSRPLSGSFRTGLGPESGSSMLRTMASSTSLRSLNSLSDEEIRRKSVLVDDLLSLHASPTQSTLVNRDLEAMIAFCLMETQKREQDELSKRVTGSPQLTPFASPERHPSSPLIPVLSSGLPSAVPEPQFRLPNAASAPPHSTQPASAQGYTSHPSNQPFQHSTPFHLAISTTGLSNPHVPLSAPIGPSWKSSAIPITDNFSHTTSHTRADSEPAHKLIYPSPTWQPPPPSVFPSSPAVALSAETETIMPAEHGELASQLASWHASPVETVITRSPPVTTNRDNANHHTNDESVHSSPDGQPTGGLQEPLSPMVALGPKFPRTPTPVVNESLTRPPIRHSKVHPTLQSSSPSPSLTHHDSPIQNESTTQHESPTLRASTRSIKHLTRRIVRHRSTKVLPTPPVRTTTSKSHKSQKSQKSSKSHKTRHHHAFDETAVPGSDPHFTHPPPRTHSRSYRQNHLPKTQVGNVDGDLDRVSVYFKQVPVFAVTLQGAGIAADESGACAFDGKGESDWAAFCAGETAEVAVTTSFVDVVDDVQVDSGWEGVKSGNGGESRVGRIEVGQMVHAKDVPIAWEGLVAVVHDEGEGEDEYGHSESVDGHDDERSVANAKESTGGNVPAQPMREDPTPTIRVAVPRSPSIIPFYPYTVPNALPDRSTSLPPPPARRPPPPPPPTMPLLTITHNPGDDDHLSDSPPPTEKSYSSLASWSTSAPSSIASSHASSPMFSVTSWGARMGISPRFRDVRPGDRERPRFKRKSTKRKVGQVQEVRGTVFGLLNADGDGAPGKVVAGDPASRQDSGKKRRIKSLIARWGSLRDGNGVLGELKDEVAKGRGKGRNQDKRR